MALLQVNFFSQALGLSSSMNVILPEADQGIGAVPLNRGSADLLERQTAQPEEQGPMPVLYLLHGLSDDHTIWGRRTSIERYVAGKRIAVVMPAVSKSFYSDEVNGMRYWEFISEELPAIVKTFFKVSDKREDTYVAGLSMGSYGAAKLALNYPERYSKAAMLSGGLTLMASVIERPDFASRIFGDASAFPGSCSDLAHVARELAKSDRPKPAFFTASGKADFIYDRHVESSKLLTELGFAVENYEEEGASHEWSFWDKTIQMALEWMDF